MNYEPLTLKDQTVNGRKSKVGHLVRDDLGRIDVSVVRVTEPGRGAYYSVKVGSIEAGRVLVSSPGYWGIVSNEADGTRRDWQVRHQPNGYSHRSTLVVAVERVVNEWATSVWYAQQRERGSAG